MQSGDGLKITALSLADVAALLSRVGGKPVTEYALVVGHETTY